MGGHKMGARKIRQVVLSLATLTGLVGLEVVQAQPSIPSDCSDLGPDWQTIEVSGQTSAGFTATGGSCSGTCEGTIIVCFNPQENCYLAVGQDHPLESLIPFTATPAGNGNLAIASVGECGTGNPSTTGKPFNVLLSSTVPGSGCLDLLTVNEGPLGSGQLISTPSGPAVLIGPPPSLLLNQFFDQSSLNIPGNHGPYGFEVHIPLIGGRFIRVRNADTGEVLGGGSVNNSCGARLDEPIRPIPTLPQYGMILLTLGLLLAAVGITRRRLSP